MLVSSVFFVNHLLLNLYQFSPHLTLYFIRLAQWHHRRAIDLEAPVIAAQHHRKNNFRFHLSQSLPQAFMNTTAHTALGLQDRTIGQDTGRKTGWDVCVGAFSFLRYFFQRVGALPFRWSARELTKISRRYA